MDPPSSSSSSASSMLPPSEAKMYVEQIATTIGLAKDSTIMLSVCGRLKEEYIVAIWQLAVLDSYQWQQLGVPIGLAAAVKYHTTTSASLQVSPATQLTPPPCVTTAVVPPSPMPAPNEASVVMPSDGKILGVDAGKNPKNDESGSPAEKMKHKGDEDEDILEQLLSSLSPPSTNTRKSLHDDAPTETSDAERTSTEDPASDSSEKAVGKNQEEESMVDSHPPPVPKVKSVEHPVSHHPEVLTECKNLPDCMDAGDATASETTTDDEEDDNGDDAGDSDINVSVQKVDIDAVFVGNSPQSSSDADADESIPPIAPAGSSDEEEDDPEAVAELVGSLGKNESRLWLDQDYKKNDDDATVVVSNVSPERKSAMKRELARKMRSSNASTEIAQTWSFEPETAALQEVLQQLPDKDHRNILSQMMIMTNARGQVARIKLALQVKDTLLECMEANNVEANSDDAVRRIFHLARLKKQYRVMFGRSLFKAMSKLYKRAEKQKEHETRRRLSSTGRKPSNSPPVKPPGSRFSDCKAGTEVDATAESYETTILSAEQDPFIALPSF